MPAATLTSDTYNNIRYVNDMSLVNSKRHLMPKQFLEAVKNNYIAKNILFENANCRSIILDIIG
jgi:hypothetical protein